MKQQELNRKIAAKDARYEKVWEQMELLGIQDVTTNRQHRNGTRVWRLPIKNNWPRQNPKYIEVASFASGYVRNQNSASSNYQLNKTKKNYEKTFSNGYEWWATERILIPNEQDRLAYLISYCLKNYYIKNANQVADGDYIPKWKYESDLEESRQRKEEIRDHFLSKEPEVKVIVNGHRYNVI